MSRPLHTSQTPQDVSNRIALVAASKGRSGAKPRAVKAEKPAPPDTPRPVGEMPLKMDSFSLGKYLLTRGKTVLTDPRLPGVEVFFELLTPELAELYLTRLPARQRKQSEAAIDRYAGDMVSDQWLFIGDALRFNQDCELIDGQHRCRAVAESEVAQMTMVVVGLDPEAIVVFDTGRPRTFTGHLQTEGIPNASAVAAVTKRVFDWRRGNYAVANIGRIPNAPFIGVPASPGKLLETFEGRRDVIQYATKRGMSAKAGFANKTASPSVLSFAFLLLGAYDVERRERFFFELEKGPDENRPEYPLFVLRERMKKQVPVGQSGLPDWVWLHFIFTTWNKWFNAESMGPLRTPARAAYGHVALPIDPYADSRPDDWDPLGGVTA